MTSTVSLYDEQKPGLSPLQLYEAKVVDNNDPERRGRIKARVRTLFDSIDDSDLPWAIPTFEHSDGASLESGILLIPKIGSKVLLYFQGGSPFHPIYRGYTIDDNTILEEGNHNYPNRALIRFKNSLLVVIDTQTNEIFIRNPGDAHILIDGNVETTIMGNSVLRVDGNRETIVNGTHTTRVKGDSLSLYGSNYTRCVEHDYSHYTRGNYYSRTVLDKQEEVHGSRVSLTVGNARDVTNASYERSTLGPSDIHIALGSHSKFVHGNSGHYCSSTIRRNAPLIHDNEGAVPSFASPYSVSLLVEPVEPQQVPPYIWPGILRGGLPRELWQIHQFW